MIKLEKITKSYGDEIKQTVLNNLDFALEDGQIHTVMGPSGSGKTTLLNILGTLIHPDSGQYLFHNTNPYSLKSNNLSDFRNQKIGFIFQNHRLLPQCNLLENILIPTIPYKKNKLIKNRALELMQWLKIEQLAYKFPSQVSGGESQRAAIARALINNPELILADEPTGALDKQLSEQLGDLLKKVSSEKKRTMVVVTHSEKLAAQLGNTFLLENGKLT